ncbi:MAG: TlyA family RNA methyltransferase [Acidimicrobiales bacterium]
MRPALGSGPGLRCREGATATRRRLDAELVRRGLAASRAQAGELIGAGAVLVAGSVAAKAARLVDPAEALEVAAPPARFVSRGGDKLDAALDQFGLDVTGRRAIDAGASTGGFTDCLLQRGAAEVVALDVGRGQLHERLRADPRVRSVERTNLRFVTPEPLGGPAAVVTADLSFISLRLVAARLVSLTAPGGDLVALVKPQFEAGRREAARGRGVIRDPKAWLAALDSAAAAFIAAGAPPCAAAVSALTGADGNVEFFLHLRADGDGADLAGAVERAAALGRGR